MKFLDLNADVLDTIASYLPSRDALSLAATCKGIHFIAMRHTIRSAVIHDHTQLARFCAHMLSDIYGRLSYLRELHISVNNISSDSSNNYPALSAVLGASHNLRSLKIMHTEGLLTNAPQLQDTITSLRKLDTVEFIFGGDRSADVITRMRSSPRHLLFHCSFTSAPLTLLTRLGNLQNLQYLNLHSAKIPVPTKSDAHACFPSVQDLRLYSCSGVVSSLVQIFPNLRSLCLGNVWLTQTSHTEAITDCWPRLDNLSVESPRDLNQWRISSPVISLVYHSAIYADEIEYACIGIRNTNPIVLSLTITETFVEVWTDVIEGNPRLRVLHLDFFGLRALWMWIDVILPVLEKSHLILIRVRIIEAFPAQEREEVQTDADKYSSWISWSIPSLQYLAFEIGSSECGLVESKRHVFWWRITTGDGGRFPTPISKEIGERIEDYTTSVAFESSMTIDDAFFA